MRLRTNGSEVQSCPSVETTSLCAEYKIPPSPLPNFASKPALRPHGDGMRLIRKPALAKKSSTQSIRSRLGSFATVLKPTSVLSISIISLMSSTASPLKLVFNPNSLERSVFIKRMNRQISAEARLLHTTKGGHCRKSIHCIY